MNSTFEIHILGGGIYFSAYGVFACLGMLFTMLLIYYRIRILPQITFKKYLILIAFLVGGVFVGSKLLFIITMIPKIVYEFSWMKLGYIIITSGFVFYGGLMGAIFGVYLFSRKFGYEFKKISNVMTPGFSLFHTFGRLGCFFGGCCYGKESVWGIAMEADPDVRRIPIQLFESMFCLLLTVFILMLEKKLKGKGWLIKWYLSIYAVGRFIFEFFRGDLIRGIWFGLSTSQWVSLGILVVLIIQIINIKIQEKHNSSQTLIKEEGAITNVKEF